MSVITASPRLARLWSLLRRNGVPVIEASLTPYLLGADEATWEARSLAFRERYRRLAPQGLTALHFEGRGAYGDYFAAQVVVADSY